MLLPLVATSFNTHPGISIRLRLQGEGPRVLLTSRLVELYLHDDTQSKVRRSALQQRDQVFEHITCLLRASVLSRLLRAQGNKVQKSALNTEVSVNQKPLRGKLWLEVLTEVLCNRTSRHVTH